MKKSKAGLCAVWVAAIILLLSIACGFYPAQALPSPGNEKINSPLKVTWVIYSGRASPYFEIKSMQELHEIETRLRDLPMAAGGTKQSEWPGAYIFELRDKEKNSTRIVSVCRSEIHVRDGNEKHNYSDTKSLRKYLEELKGRYKLISGDVRPVP